MNVKLQLKLEPRSPWQTVEVPVGTTLAALADSWRDQVPYQILAAKVNYRVAALTETVTGPANVEFLDMRTQSANLIYQNSLILLYLRAIGDVIQPVEVDIEYALNKGLFTAVKTPIALSNALVRKIEARMRALVEADLPITREVVSREQAREIFISSGQEERVRLLNQLTQIDRDAQEKAQKAGTAVTPGATACLGGEKGPAAADGAADYGDRAAQEKAQAAGAAVCLGSENGPAVPDGMTGAATEESSGIGAADRGVAAAPGDSAGAETREGTGTAADTAVPGSETLGDAEEAAGVVPAGVTFYALDGYKDFFYGEMVPSTGYLQYFQLRRYKSGILLRFPHPSAPDQIPPFVDEVMLYKTFGEQSRWGRLMGIDYVTDLNEKIENGGYKELIQLSEALHERRIVEIADMITRQKKRMILIAGPSSSGKTTFARRLCIQLRVNGLDPLYMGTDDYFVEREQTPLDVYGERDYENLNAVDIPLFNRNMQDLLAGKAVDLPAFNFLTGSKEFGKRVTSIRPDQPIVIEGIHALNEDLTPSVPREQKFKIYISPLTQLNIDSHNRIVTTDHRMLRRMVRDYKYRGHTAQSTIQAWPKVRAGEDKNIFPYSNEADVLFNSVHLYEISVLKKYAEPLLRSITSQEPAYADAVRLLNFLRFFRTIEDDSMVAGNSILREFIGGSIFVE